MRLSKIPLLTISPIILRCAQNDNVGGMTGLFFDHPMADNPLQNSPYKIYSAHPMAQPEILRYD